MFRVRWASAVQTCLWGRIPGPLQTPALSGASTGDSRRALQIHCSSGCPLGSAGLHRGGGGEKGSHLPGTLGLGEGLRPPVQGERPCPGCIPRGFLEEKASVSFGRAGLRKE